MNTPYVTRTLTALTMASAFLLAACSPPRMPAAPASTLPPPAVAVITQTAAPLPPAGTEGGQAEEAAPAETPAPAKPPASLPLPPPDEASARLQVADGFAIRVFAQGLAGRPRFMAFGPDGALYLSLTAAGRIVRLPDEDGDGLADSIQVAAEGLNQPHGLEWQGDWLYVAENDRVARLSSTAGDGVLDVKELVTDNIPGGGGHFTRTIHFGPDGKIYVSAGSSCNVCAETDPRRAAILRFNADGSIPADNPFAMDADPRWRSLWAWGLRNSVDFLWTPSGQMWANMNGRDNLLDADGMPDNLLDADGMPDNLPPEAIVIPVQAGRSHGWPYCYTAVQGVNSEGDLQVLDLQSGLALPDGFDCSQAVPALFTGPAHSAPLGMTLGAAGNFPEQYLPDLYVALHGSWNVQNPANIRDCRVERVIIESGLPVRSEPFVNGWRADGQSCGSPSAFGRPADVIFGPNGAMYISDDAGGRVYRLVHTP